MYKRMLLCCLLAAALLLSGCSLARPETQSANRAEDKMVGVLVTREHLDLFDMERYFQDNAEKIVTGGTVSEAETQKYRSALFSEWDEASQRYVFPDVDGYVYLCTEQMGETGTYTNMQNDDVFCGGASAIHVTDDGVSYDFSATIYAENNAGTLSFYMNPIYQTEDGRVYALTGSGITFSSDEGSSASTTQTLEQTLSRTENGEKQEYAFRCAIKVQLAPRPDQVTLFWMDAENGVRRQQTYAAGTLPKALKADGASFLVAVQTAQDGTQSCTLYSREEETQQLETLCGRENGLLSMQYTELDWN